MIIVFPNIPLSNPKPLRENNRNEEPQKQQPEAQPILAEVGTWEHINASAPEGTSARASILTSDNTSITIVADFYGFWRKEENDTVTNSKYDTLNMPGASNINSIGKPAVPMLIEYVEIPHDINVSLVAISGSYVGFTGYNVTPAQPLAVPTYNMSIPQQPFIVDDIYETDAFFPTVNASIVGESSTEEIVMRGRRLLEISFYPVQFNPRSHDLIAYSQIIIMISYSQVAEIEPVREALRSRAFEVIFSSFILNFIPVEILPAIGHGIGEIDFTLSPTEADAEYLIITVDEFVTQARRLANWKTRTGLLTEVVTTSEIDALSSNPVEQDIKDYISDAYDTWNPGLVYVLLFGDCPLTVLNGPDRPGIPTLYEGMIHPATDPNGRKYHTDDAHIGTDLYYFTVDGDYYIPDILYGRISVEDENEATYIVDKILDYERNPTDDADFYNSILASAYFEDNRPDLGWEDSEYPYVTTSEEIRRYLEGLECPYDVHFNYSTNTTASTPPLFLADGTDILSDPDLMNYNWIAIDEDPATPGEQNLLSRDAMLRNFRDGRFLMWHYDHGDSINFKRLYYDIISGSFDTREGLIAPRLYDDGTSGGNDYFLLSKNQPYCNSYKLPLFLSLDCMTGWFDGETDQLLLSGESRSAYTNLGESFAERMIRLEEGGAVAVIAPTRLSYNLPAAHLLRGIIDSFWPGLIDPNHEASFDFGSALYNGKNNLLSHYGIETYYARTAIEMYHLFGDPTTQLWTHYPCTLSVSFDISAPGQQEFVVEVKRGENPAFMAKVCLQQGDNLYDWGYTDENGIVTFEINPNLGLMNITVTAHNCSPYYTTVYVGMIILVIIITGAMGLVLLGVVVIIRKKK